MVREPKLYKYVDDALQTDKVNMENSDRLRNPDRLVEVRTKHAVNTQNFFQRVTGRAEWKGLKVNTSKTKLLCISDALSYEASSYIELVDGSTVKSGERGDSMKLLGFHLSDRPGVAAHVDVLKKKFRRRFWILIHLRVMGFTPEELVRLY